MGSEPAPTTRYEYRVWGKHKKARRLLAAAAEQVRTESVTDCYFLVDSAKVNVKVRDDTLKVKRLVGSSRGFDRWVAHRYRGGHDVPEQFIELARALRLHKSDRKSFDLVTQVESLDDDHPTPVFVTKERTHYRLGALRAEVTDLTIDATGEQLHTIAIEGADLDALVALRKRLGLKGTDNIAVPDAIGDVANGA